MLSLLTCSQIRQIEHRVFQSGVSPESLMQEAAGAAFKVLLSRWPDCKQLQVVIGKGNNAGDGCVLARIAQQQGFHSTIYLVGERADLTEVTALRLDEAIAAGAECLPMADFEPVSGAVCVDAMLGIGLEGELPEHLQKAIEVINEADMPVLSIDVPSGVNADTGGLAQLAVKATVTVTFIAHKIGLFTGKAVSYVGELVLDTLSVSKEATMGVSSVVTCLTEETAAQALPKRAKHAHKGDFGHTLVIGGDYGMGGAVRMAAEAAMRTGSGLVTVATRPEHVTIVSGSRPELMCHAVTQPADCERLLARATVVVLGPGLGQSDWGQWLYDLVMDTSLPKILDADALTLLSNQPTHHDHWILTPHPGEAARLLGCTTEEVQNDRMGSARRLQSRYGGQIVLKGAGTLLCDDEQELSLCPYGNAGMASGGMGDILSGVLGGLLAQRVPMRLAAQAGVTLHALAADRVAARDGERGLLATDVLNEIRAFLNP